MDYQQLVRNLEIGREVEFHYKYYFVTISNSQGYWWLYYSNKLEEVDFLLAEFSNKKKLIEELSKIILGEISILDIFNKKLYEPDSLFIY